MATVLKYTAINNSTEYEVTGYTSVDANLVIPSTYYGKPVTSIGKSAFSRCSSLESIAIPASVTSIGNSAFYKCTSLTKINYIGTIDEWVQIEFGNDRRIVCFTGL